MLVNFAAQVREIFFTHDITEKNTHARNNKKWFAVFRIPLQTATTARNKIFVHQAIISDPELG